MDRVDVQLKFGNKWFKKSALKLTRIPSRGDNFKLTKGSATEFIVTHVRWTIATRPEIQCSEVTELTENEEKNLVEWLVRRRWKKIN